MRFAGLMFAPLFWGALSATPLPSSPELHHPIPGHRSLAASFGEYRFAHLHSGIDFSTMGKTGFPVQAVASGEIYRLKVEWRGYGRAVYIRHQDGKVSVYAHLERFEEDHLGLEGRVATEQRKKGGRYPGDIYLNPPVTVEGGATVGFSGESGAGLPHLHFELRQAEDRPADPLFKGWIAAEVSSAPVFGALVLLAEREETRFGRARQIEIPLRLDGEGRYVPTRNITVTGPFVPLALVHSEGGRGHRLGIRGLTVKLDGREVYRFELQDFRFSDFPKVGVLMNHSQSRLSPTQYAYYLKRMSGNDLGRVGPEDPWPALDPGPHLLEVGAVSPLREVSRAHVPFEVVTPARPVWVAPPLPGETSRLRVNGGGGKPGRPLTVRYFPLGSEHPIPCRDRVLLPDGEECRFDLEPPVRGVTARVYWKDLQVGVATHILDMKEGPSSRRASLEVVSFGDFLELRARVAGGSVLPNRLLLGPEKSARLRPFAEVEPGRLVAALTREDWALGGSLRLGWADGTVTSGSPNLDRMALAEPASAIVLKGGGAELRLLPRTLFQTTFVGCQEAPDEVPPPPGLTRVSPVVSFRPEGLPLALKSTLRFALPGSGDEKVGIYRWDSSKREWRYWGGEREHDSITTQVSRFDTFALIRDDSPPRILGVDSDPAESARSSSTRLRIRVEDEGSGLSYDGVRLTLNGVQIETEYDPDRGWSIALPAADLPSGTQPGEAWAVDRSGNRSETLTFSVTLR